MLSSCFIPTRYQINLTYRCNLSCKWCISFIDNIPFEDSDITIEDLKIGGELVKQYGVQDGWLRVSGGESLLHPEVKECCRVIKEFWNGSKKTLFTNGIISVPKGLGIRYIVSPPGIGKKTQHTPPMISPADLGIEPVLGFTRSCAMQSKCGRLFDAFGFSFCPYAGCIGRILKIDPYQSRPILMGLPSMCEHCLWSLSKVDRLRLSEDVKNGRLEYPTKTFREGVERHKEEPIKYKKFQERIVNSE